MAYCAIDQKGDCGGNCAEVGESCVRYQVVPGGNDPWPNQLVYEDDENKKTKEDDENEITKMKKI